MGLIPGVQRYVLMSNVTVIAVAMTYMSMDPALIGNPWWVATTFNLNQFDTGTSYTAPSPCGPSSRSLDVSVVTTFLKLAAPRVRFMLTEDPKRPFA